MTMTPHHIEVPIPAGAHATREDMEVLDGLVRAIAAMHFNSGRQWPRVRRALERGGWKVRWALQWHVEARRGRELEQACGETLDEAFAIVSRTARMEEAPEGLP